MNFIKKIFKKENIPTKSTMFLGTILLYVLLKVIVVATPTPVDDKIPDVMINYLAEESASEETTPGTLEDCELKG